MYMLPLAHILKQYNISYHNYADDTQIDITINPDDKGPLQSLKSCIQQISTWRNDNFLQLNKDKTETIVFGAKKDRANIRTQLE